LPKQLVEATMLIDDFLNYLLYERNYSALTVHNYGDDLKSFESYFMGLDNQLTWESVDSDVIRNWMESMMDKGNAATSINRRLSALRSFFRFALARGLVSHDPAHQVKGPKKQKVLPQYVRETELDNLLDITAEEENFMCVRARTIIMMFYETGLRLSELVSLNDEQVDLERMEVKVTGKRNKQRVVPFGEELRGQVEHYKEIRDREVQNAGGALFVTPKGERMNAAQVRYQVEKQIGRVSARKKRSPHVLRHSFATAMLNHDAGIESVRKLLGHESLSTTEIYTHTTYEQLKKVYDNAHPRA